MTDTESRFSECPGCEAEDTASMNDWRTRALKAEDENRRWMDTYNALVAAIPPYILDQINGRTPT